MKNFTRYVRYLFFLFFFSPLLHAQVTVTGGSGYPAGTPMMGIAYGNSVYVAVGYYGTIIKSTNGTSWTIEKTSSFVNTTYKAIAFGNGIFVATSNDGNIVTSPDGTNWTSRVSGTSNYLSDIIYANSKFLIVGSNNTVLTSTDGITWTSVSIGAQATDGISSVIYAQGKFVVGVRDAATGSCQSYISTTGAAGTWSHVTFGTGTSLNRIVYLNNKFFAFTALTNIYTSSDGVTWSALVNSRLTTPNQVFTGFYDGSKYYLFGSSSENGYGSAFTSTDGTTFTLQAQSTTIVGQGAAILNGRYFQVGNEGLVSSSDGNTWSFPAGTYSAIAYNGIRYVAVGQNTSNEAAIYNSTDFTNWSSSLSSVIKPLNGVTYGNGKFVAVGNANASLFSTVATSSDGLTWSTGNTGIADALKSVTYGNSKYVAVGVNGRIIYSSDGVSWTSAENVSGYNYYSVAFLNNYFIAVGGSTVIGGAAKVKYSSNGITWTDVSPTTPISGHFHSIAYNGTKYLLVGRDNTTGSQKFFSVTTSDITTNNGYSSAVTATTPEGDVGTLGYGGVIYNNSIFTAIVNLKVTPFSAYILTSPNGASWTATAASTTGRLRGIVASGSSSKIIGTLDTHLSVSTGTTLPVHLLDFSARNNATNISLLWNTVNEENADRFEVERSNDGMKFISIASVTAINTPDHHSYQTNDAAPGTGTKYYRLKMIDRDGKFSYSQVLRIESASIKTGISIYPNPATGYFTLTLPRNLPASMVIFNGKGEKMMEKTTSGNSSLVNISSLLSGTYIVRVTQDGKIYTEKLISK